MKTKLNGLDWPHKKSSFLSWSPLENSIYGPVLPHGHGPQQGLQVTKNVSKPGHGHVTGCPQPTHQIPAGPEPGGAPPHIIGVVTGGLRAQVCALHANLRACPTVGGEKRSLNVVLNFITHHGSRVLMSHSSLTHMLIGLNKKVKIRWMLRPWVEVSACNSSTWDWQQIRGGQQPEIFETCLHKTTGLEIFAWFIPRSHTSRSQNQQTLRPLGFRAHWLST